MREKGLPKFFENFLKKDPIFVNKKALQVNYTPDEVPHREEQIEYLAGVLAPALRLEKPSNIFIYGKTGCIGGDSLVYTDKGYVKIKEIDKNSRILSFNKKIKSYEWSEFIFLKFENRDKLLKVELDNGLNLIVTKDHPLLLPNMQWKKADQIKIDEGVVLGYDLPNLTKKQIPLEFARLLGFVIGGGSLNKKERRTKDSKGYWYYVNRQRFRFFNNDFNLLDLVKKDIETLWHKYTPQIILEKDKCPYVEVISQEVCDSLNSNDIPFGPKSSIVQIPKIIFESSYFIQREFLKALFTGGGTVSKNPHQIGYYSNSKKLLKNISYLLHQEGISCKIRYKKLKLGTEFFDSYRLYIQGQENLIKFHHKIGFFSREKTKNLKCLLNKYQKNMKINEDNFVVSKIKKISEVYEPYVYDLSVPKNHNFIANGIISHNTGKSVSATYVVNSLLETAKKNKLPLKIVYLNCKLRRVADTEYRLIAQIARSFGLSIPATGLPTQEVYKAFIEVLDEKKILLILVLDEIDQLVYKIGDAILYNLTRLNAELKNSEISLVGISNDLIFADNLDPRVKSSLSEEELVFPPYNAIQLQSILNQRSKIAFRKNIVGEGVIEKCAAYAAREHGDARRALELLRVSGEISERKNKTKISISNIDEAEEKIERDRVLDIVNTQPKQFKLTLFSILQVCNNNIEQQIFTGDVYNIYKDVCIKVGLKPLTQRRLSDIIAELDMLGIINAKVISKGRYGRTREITLAIPSSNIEKIRHNLKEGLDL